MPYTSVACDLYDPCGPMPVLLEGLVHLFHALQGLRRRPAVFVNQLGQANAGATKSWFAFCEVLQRLH